MRQGRPASLLSLLIAMLAVGCFGPDYPEGIPCSGRDTCPPSQTCDVDGVCRTNPSTSPDAGPAPVDAEPATADATPTLSCADCAPDAVCDDSGATVVCRCQPGFSGDGLSCVDEDECAMSPSPCGVGECVNEDGGYACDCPAGFADDGVSCVDIDECGIAPDPCGVGVCVNEDGGYACDCPAGFADDGVSCVDIDECSATPTPCDPNASCANSPGSFTCTCNDGFFGDGQSCRRPRACADLLALDPTAGTGIYLIDPDDDGPVAPFDVFCDMDREGGGWTLVLVSSDDGVHTWTAQERERMTTNSAPIGDLTAQNRDFKSPAYHAAPFRSLLFVHQPSGVSAAYDDVSDASGDIGSFIAAVPYPVCDFGLAGNGHPLTGGTLTTGGVLCDTDLYFNVGDHESGNVATCSNPTGSFNHTSFGPVWNGRNNGVCPFDDPYFFAIGPQEQCADCPAGSGAQESNALGFGSNLGLNTGQPGAGENFIQMYIR